MNEIMTTVFGLAGGLAMFLFGMNSMSDALQKAAGERMKQILSFLTKNPIMGALAGALVTAVLQSSSATTVMVIGFVSAGLMTLPQGISVIFGANIGTTMTAQLMAFKISDYIYPIIFIGFLVYFIAKSEKAKNIGMVIFSFGLLYVSNNIDRMTEYSQRVTQTVQQVYQSGRKLSASAEQELNECYDTAHDLFDRAVDSVRYGDADMAQQVLADKKKLRKAQKRFNKAHMARVKAGKCEANLTADFSAILYGLERMVDNSVNIAEETLDSIHFVELEPAQMEALSDRGIPVPVPAQ